MSPCKRGMCACFSSAFSNSVKTSPVPMCARSFHAREEVLALRNALAAIEWPDDELSVYATLRGPFFAVTDDALLAYRHQFNRLSPLRRVDEAEQNPLTKDVAEALFVLGR